MDKKHSQSHRLGVIKNYCKKENFQNSHHPVHSASLKSSFFAKRTKHLRPFFAKCTTSAWITIVIVYIFADSYIYTRSN